MRVSEHKLFMTTQHGEKIYMLDIFYEHGELDLCRSKNEVDTCIDPDITKEIPHNGRLVFRNAGPDDCGFRVHVRYAVPKREIKKGRRFVASYGPRRRPTSAMSNAIRVGKAIVHTVVQELT